MASLTPQHRKAEVVDTVMKEGWMNGLLTLIPSSAGVYLGLRNPTFRKYTNTQSRTAMVIMPALFMFALTAENKLLHRMHEVAEEEEHTLKTVDWAERQMAMNAGEKLLEHHDLYRQAILAQGHIRLVDSEKLGTHHQLANYIQANPFKIILGLGIPSVGAIFYGRNHLSMQLRILETRVFGQFAVICTLLGVMGVKATMDAQGRYVTNDEVEQRVEEMQTARLRLLHRIEQANQQATNQRLHPHHNEDKAVLATAAAVHG